MSGLCDTQIRSVSRSSSVASFIPLWLYPYSTFILIQTKGETQGSICVKVKGDKQNRYVRSVRKVLFFPHRTTSSLTGNKWFIYNYVTFQIFSKYATDGTPVQYGDVVAFKYPYAFNSAWLYRYSSNFYPRSCSTNSKSSCATENTTTGFRIFKKL